MSKLGRTVAKGLTAFIFANLLFYALAGWTSGAQDVISYQFEEEINLAGRLYGVPAGLIAAVIKAESNFDPQAVSPRGAEGLMQLMPDTARELGVEDSFNPLSNILSGTKYLRQMYERFGTWRLALIAYNWGPTNLVKKGEENMPEETRNYLKRIGELYDYSLLDRPRRS